MQVAVIGAGVVGVCTAYFLAAAGHEVVVLERYGNVAQETSSGHAGIISTGLAVPLASPGAPRRLLGWLSRAESPVLLRPALGPALWRWLRRWYRECELQRFNKNVERMQRLTNYSKTVLASMRQQHAFSYEQSRGLLQLFRSLQDRQLAEAAISLLGESGVPHRLLEPQQAREIEPALGQDTHLHSALYFPDDEGGNCALFTRQLRHVMQEMGVEFHFNSAVQEIASAAGGRVSFQIDRRLFEADAVLLATGAEETSLLPQAGLKLPLYPVKGFSATAAIKNFDRVPVGAIHDETYQVAISRLGQRIRVAGLFELGKPDLNLHPSAVRTLIKCGEDWFPDATNYNNAIFWCGMRAMLPDGVPLLGHAPMRNVYVNIAHGTHGWAMAPGAGKILAEMISGRTPELDIDGLTLARYG